MLNPALARSPGSRSRFRRMASSFGALLHNVNGKENAHNVDNAVNDSSERAGRPLRGLHAASTNGDPFHDPIHGRAVPRRPVDPVQVFTGGGGGLRVLNAAGQQTLHRGRAHLAVQQGGSGSILPTTGVRAQPHSVVLLQPSQRQPILRQSGLQNLKDAKNTQLSSRIMSGSREPARGSHA